MTTLTAVPKCYKCGATENIHHRECASCRNARTLEYKRNGHWSKTIPNEQRRARVALGAAVRSGKIIKPTRCEQCGKETESKHLHGHHADYSKRFEVKWLCRQCHNNLTVVSVLAEPLSSEDSTPSRTSQKDDDGEARESTTPMESRPAAKQDSRGGGQSTLIWRGEPSITDGRALVFWLWCSPALVENSLRHVLTI